MLNNIAALLDSAAVAAVGDYESIATVTVGAGGAATVSFTSIVGTYKHLQIRSIQRNTGDGNGVQIGSTQFNSDTGNNYTRHNLVGNGSSASASATASTSGVWTGIMVQTADLANSFGSSIMDILDYSNVNKYKTTRTLEGYDLNGSGQICFRSGLWQNTAAISRIDITSTLFNFSQYTTFALYGIK